MTIMISGIPIDIHKKNIKNMHLQVLLMDTSLSLLRHLLMIR